MFLPERIRLLTGNNEYETDDVGMSGSSVLLYADKVLKVQECSEEAENEYRMMQYLQGRLPVPEILAYQEAGGRGYLLMSKCRGRMACSGEYLEDPAGLCRLLADGLKRLWSVDIADCPSDMRLSRKLAMAARNVENGLVDTDSVEPETFGEGGFKDPADLLRWLYDNKPEEEPVLSHGDYCLPNVFGRGGRVSGYIDLGKTGIADRWCDIALCCRSLIHNYDGSYGGSGYHEKPAKQEETHLVRQLFRELGMEPDREKLRYYILLDELF